MACSYVTSGGNRKCESPGRSLVLTLPIPSRPRCQATPESSGSWVPAASGYRLRQPCSAHARGGRGSTWARLIPAPKKGVKAYAIEGRTCVGYPCASQGFPVPVPARFLKSGPRALFPGLTSGSPVPGYPGTLTLPQACRLLPVIDTDLNWTVVRFGAFLARSPLKGTRVPVLSACLAPPTQVRTLNLFQCVHRLAASQVF